METYHHGNVVKSGRPPSCGRGGSVARIAATARSHHWRRREKYEKHEGHVRDGAVTHQRADMPAAMVILETAAGLPYQKGLKYNQMRGIR